MSEPSQTPAPPAQTSAARGKQKAFTGAINVGAEDVKYQAKYKELKRKVKDIEADNDKLQVKVMNAKLTIQRMKMERAVLYERLALSPNSPSLQDRVPLPMAAPSGVPPHQPMSTPHHLRDVHDHSAASADPDPGFPAFQEYATRPRGTPTQPQSIEGRPPTAIDTVPPPGVAHSPHMSITHSPRRVSAEHEARQRIPMGRPLPPSGMGPYERPHSSSHASPPMEHDYPPPTHHIRTRSQSSSRSRTHQMQPSSYREGQYPEMQTQAFSPHLSDQERSRHSEMRNMPPQPEPHAHPHHQAPLAQLSPRSSTSDLRARMHPHQRVGPGTYINRDEYPDRQQRDLDRDREWDQERTTRDLARNRDMPPSIHSPHSVHRTRQPMDRNDYPDHHMSSARDEQPQFYDAPPSRSYPHVSRSGTPGSASGSGAGLNEDSSRPDSRAAQYYQEQDRARTSTYRVRTVGGPNSGEENMDFLHEDGRAHPRTDRAPSGGGNFPVPEQTLPSAESRKRSRNEMDVDSENDVADSSRGTGHYSTSHSAEDRGAKRYHRERAHRRSMDGLEDNRVGPS
ncbi:hypothetical protein CC2G_010250 [Coprinopsis cinerea AmutBmut pab1-1]|nr:hypothetical protein CC2G_010250 [Coprinopsis cinerea AmutBmut pab1-1]